MSTTLADRLDQILDPATLAAFQRDGCVMLRGLIDPATIVRWRAAITPRVLAEAAHYPPLAERGTYGQAFLQVANLWRREPMAEEVIHDPLLAGAAARLLGARKARLYHDQALYKESGGGHTPWHVDQVYWPLADARSVTAWIPLVDCDRDMGPLCFAPGSQSLEACRHLTISDESHRQVAAMLHQAGIKPRAEPYAVGDVSFHAGWCYHCAGPNRSGQAREVMTVISMAEDMRLAEPRSKAQDSDRQHWCPGVAVGDIIASELNPILG